MHLSNQIGLVKQELPCFFTCWRGSKHKVHTVGDNLLHCGLKFLLQLLIKISVLFFLHIINFRLLRLGVTFPDGAGLVKHLF
jgi:hypothetical protein